MNKLFHGKYSSDLLSQLLRDELKAFFGGQKAAPHLDFITRKEVMLWLNHYLTFYECIQLAWCEIKRVIELKYIVEFTPQTPGECLIQVLQEDWMESEPSVSTFDICVMALRDVATKKNNLSAGVKRILAMKTRSHAAAYKDLKAFYGGDRTLQTSKS